MMVVAAVIVHSSKAVASCDYTFNSTQVTSLQNTVNSSSSSGKTVCLSPSTGTFPYLTFQGTHTSDVTLTPDPSQDPNGAGKVTVDGVKIDLNSSHIKVRNFYMTGEMRMQGGTSNITFEHNDVYTSGMILSGPSSGSSLITNATIKGNKIHHLGGCLGEDAIQAKGFNGLTITENEFTDIVQNDCPGEPVPHSDALQTMFTNYNLVFDHNYEHDNRMQGFFTSDGTVTDVSLTNNLMIRNDVYSPSQQPSIVSVASDLGTFDISHNTIWSNGQGIIFHDCNWSDIQIHYNVTYAIKPADSTLQTCVPPYITEDYNDMDNYFNSMTPGPHTVATDPSNNANTPHFIDPTGSAAAPYSGDWRLSGQITHGGATYSAGIDWLPTQYTYGPINDGGAPTTPSDTTPPSVSVTAPSVGATVSGTVSLSATATDAESAVTSVQFKVDGTTVNTDVTSPYSYGWDSATVANGSHTITAVATSSGGTTTSSSVTVTVSNAAPPSPCDSVTAVICDDYSTSTGTYTTTNGTWGVSGGTYNLTSPVDTGNNVGVDNRSLHNTPVTGDFTYTVDEKVLASGGTFDDFAAIFNYQNASNYYYASFNQSNDVNTNGLFRVVGGVQTELADFSPTISANTTYAIKVVKSGSSIQVYRNNTLIGSATDATFTGGQVGVGSRNNSVVVDNMIVTVSASAIPTNSSPPTISGITNMDAKLTAASGVWTNSPTSYTYQWQRCDLAGANCVDIAGAISSTYVLTQPEVGSTIRVNVIAVNGSGSSSSVASAATAKICKKGDIDHNGTINGLDVSTVTNNYGKSAAQSTDPNADTNSDGTINGLDLSNVTNNYGL